MRTRSRIRSEQESSDESYYLPSPLVRECGEMSRGEIEPGEGLLSADRDPSSGALRSASALQSAPPSPTRGEGKKEPTPPLPPSSGTPDAPRSCSRADAP